MKTHQSIRRFLGLGTVLLLASLSFSSCGYFYTATIQGYVIDSSTVNGTAGVNNATIWLYEKDPGTVNEADAKGPDGFFAKTSTSSQGNNAGYYTAKVVWNNLDGKYAQEGDSTSFWVVITHSDYKTIKYELPGILSKSTNTVPDLRVKRATFQASSVSGRILDSSGNGINGIRVVINLYPDDADTAVAGNEDYVATTATPAGGVIGTYTFNNVTWKDVAATGTTDTQKVRIKVADNQYSGKTELTPTLSSGSANTLPDTDTITVVRKPRSNFTAQEVRGQIVDATGKGINGIRVVINLYPTNTDPLVAGNEDYVATTATPAGGDPGTYIFNNVAWTDTTATGETDSQTVRIKVADTQYQGDEDLSAELSSDVINTLADTITISRKPHSDFTANLQGRILRHYAGTSGDSYTGAQGVTVTLTFAVSATENKVMTAQTDAQGTYTFALAWKDSTPGNYDDGAADVTTVDTSLPVSEDGLKYSIKFDGLPTKDLGATLNVVQFTGQTTRNPAIAAGPQSPADTTVTYSAQQASSDKNPNYFPDGILDLQ